MNNVTVFSYPNNRHRNGYGYLFLSLYKLVNSNFYIALLLIQLFYIKRSNKTSTSAKNFCRSWSSQLWSNWKSFFWQKNWLGTHSALLCPHRRHKNIQFFICMFLFLLKPRYDQFWGLCWSCWMLRQWPVGTKHSGIWKFIWVSSLRCLKFLCMKLTVILPVCFPSVFSVQASQLPSWNTWLKIDLARCSILRNILYAKIGRKLVVLNTERRENYWSATLSAVSGNHCGNWLMITGGNRSGSIFNRKLFFGTRFSYINREQFFGIGLRACGFL